MKSKIQNFKSEKSTGETHSLNDGCGHGFTAYYLLKLMDSNGHLHGVWIRGSNGFRGLEVSNDILLYNVNIVFFYKSS